MRRRVYFRPYLVTALHTIAENEVKAEIFIESKTMLHIKMGQMGEFGSAQ
jgi:hypothetical protein